MSALIDGMIAGYGVAIPLGAISVLIVNRSIDEGFRSGFIAGAGAATVDGLCAAMVVFAGVLVSSWLSPVKMPIQLLGGLVLILMGFCGVVKAWQAIKAPLPVDIRANSSWRTYLQFIGLTILNPFTIIYFLSLIMGGSVGWISSSLDCTLFIVGVIFASLSWQTILAIGGALAKKHLSSGCKIVTVLLGNLIVVLLGVNVLLS